MKRARDQNDREDDYCASLNASLLADTDRNDRSCCGSSISSPAEDKLVNESQKNRDNDQGHRYGNFHNYYSFHPVSNRTKHIEEIFTWIAQQWNEFSVTQSHHICNAFRYFDIGCNEGDLTLEIAKLLSNRISSAELLPNQANTEKYDAVISKQQQLVGRTKILCTGFDLDADLIRRAQRKVHENVELQSNIDAQFQVRDVLLENIDFQDSRENKTDSVNPSIKYSADLTTMFSTTMWIHIHGGDDGLRRVLQNICSCTQFWILLEPQPSKCYGRAAFRLRRLGLPPIDVSNDRLRLRPNIEDAIEQILKEFQFERVQFSHRSKLDTTSLQGQEIVDTRTQWNRTLRLYQRVNILDTLERSL